MGQEGKEKMAHIFFGVKELSDYGLTLGLKKEKGPI